MIIKYKVNHICKKNRDSEKKICLNRGGTSSGKTYGVLHLVLDWLLTGHIGEFWGYDETGVFTVARKFGTSLETSVMRDFINISIYYGAAHLIKQNKTKRTFTYEGRVVEFTGLDDVTKIAKGPRRTHLLMDECDEFQFRDFTQLILRTNKRVFINFNPDDEDCWMNREIEEKRFFIKKDVDIIVSTYKDNKPFLPKDIIEEIEYLQESNPMAWQVYGLGKYGRIKGRIFTNWDVIDKVPEEARFLGYGLDFGFKVSKTALVAIYQWNQGVIWEEIIHSTGLLNKDIDKEATDNGVSKQSLTVADCAEPKTIEELKRTYQWNIIGCLKGKDSVMHRISTAQGMKIYVPAYSENVKREIKKYRWAENKQGESLKVPVKKDDDAMDAAMYATEFFLGKPKPDGSIKYETTKTSRTGMMEKVF